MLKPNKVVKVRTKAGWQYRVNIRNIVVKKDGTFHIEEAPDSIGIDIGKNKFALKVWKFMARFVDEKGNKIVPSKEVIESVKKKYPVTFVHTGHRGIEARIVLKRFPKIEKLFKDLPYEKKIARFKLLMRRKLFSFKELGFEKVRIVEMDNQDDIQLTDGVIWVTGKKNKKYVGAEVKGFAKGTIDIMPDEWKKKLKAKTNEVIIPSHNIKIKKPTINQIWIAEKAKVRMSVKNEFEYAIQAMINKPLKNPKVTWDLNYIASLVDTGIGIDNMASNMLKALVPLDCEDFINMAKPMIDKEISRLFGRAKDSITGFAVALPSYEVDWNIVYIPKHIARQMFIKEGDTVIVTRNPIPGIVGLVRMQVSLTDEPVIRINPYVWHKVMKGDFDGDLAQIITNKEVIKAGMNVYDAVSVAEQYEIKQEEEEDTFESIEEAYRYTVENASLVGPLTIRWYEKFNGYLGIRNKRKRALEMLKGFASIQKAIDGMKHRMGSIANRRNRVQPNEYLQAIRGTAGLSKIELRDRIKIIKKANKKSDDIWERVVASRSSSMPDFGSLPTVRYDYSEAAREIYEEMKENIPLRDIDIAKMKDFVINYHMKNGWGMSVMNSLISDAKCIIKSNKYRKLAIAFSESIVYKRGIARAAVVNVKLARRIVQRAVYNRNKRITKKRVISEM